MAINNSKFYIDTITEGSWIAILSFNLDGSIVPVLYEEINGIKTYVSWKDPRILSLEQLSSSNFRIKFNADFVGYIELLAYKADAVSIEQRVATLSSTITTQNEAIAQRVYIESWKQMNNYLESEIVKLQKALAQTNATIALMQTEIDSLKV